MQFASPAMGRDVTRRVFLFLGFSVVLILAVGAATAAGAGTHQLPDAEAPAANDTTAAVASSETASQATAGGAIPTTLQGDLTTEPVAAGDRILVGTERGLYVVTDGSIQQFVQTQPVRRITHAGGDVAIVLLEDSNFPNVKAIDLTSGEVRWSHSRSRTVYSPEFGTIDRQVPAFDATAIGDRGGDGATDVAVSAGSAVVALDGSTGDVLWSATADHTVYRLASVENTVVAGTGGGSVLGIDAGSGERTYERQLTGSFQHEAVGPVERGVWDVEAVDVGGSTQVVVTTEQGSVALLSPADGSTRWSERLASFDNETLAEYYRHGRGQIQPTGPGDAHFFNVEVTPIERSDGPTLLAATVYIEERPARRAYQLRRQELHLLDADSGAVQWTNAQAPVGQAGSIAYDASGGRLVVPSPPGDSLVQEVATYDVADGSDGVIEAASVPGRRGGPDTGTGYALTSGDVLVVGSTSGDLKALNATGGVQWNVPTLRDGDVVSGDFTGDGTDDYLVHSNNRRQGQFEHRVLVLRDGSDGSIVWTRAMAIDQFVREGGLSNLRTVPTGDGLDVVALQRQPRERAGEQQRPLVRLVHISGRDGTELASYDLVNDDQHAQDRDQRFGVRTLAVLGDLSGDGTPDVLLGADSRVFAIELATGDVVWERLYRDVPPRADATQWRPVEGNNIRYASVGGEGDLNSLVAVSTQSGNLAVLEPDTSGGELSFDSTTEAEVGELRGGIGLGTLPDRNGDGYDEVTYVVRNDQGGELTLFSPGDGSVVSSLRSPRRSAIHATDGDTSGDESGFVTFQEGDDGTTTTVYRGFDQVARYEQGRIGQLRNYGITTPRPASPAGDVDGDGDGEIALAKTSAREGSMVELYDPGAEEPLDQIVLEPYREVNQRPMPGAHVQQIADRTGDGVPELGVVALSGRSNDAEMRFYVLDPVERTVLVEGVGVPTSFYSFEDRLGMITDDGSLQTVDPNTAVELSEPAVDGGRVDLQWTLSGDDQYVSTVVVNDSLVAQTTGQSATVRLPGGEHTIGVEAITADGITVRDQRTVTVSAGSSSNIVLYGATGLSFALVFGLALVPPIRRRLG